MFGLLSTPHVDPEVCLAIWVWLKIKQEGLRWSWSMFPLTRVPFWYRFFEPQPYQPPLGVLVVPTPPDQETLRRRVSDPAGLSLRVKRPRFFFCRGGGVTLGHGLEASHVPY